MKEKIDSDNSFLEFVNSFLSLFLCSQKIVILNRYRDAVLEIELFLCWFFWENLCIAELRNYFIG